MRRLEVITGTGRRRQFSEDFKAGVVEETLVPGTVVSDVARRHGLTPQQVFTWRRQARQPVASETEAAKFVPAVVDATFPARPSVGRPRKRTRQVDHRLPYTWVIEGDIKGCFDNINHHHLMDQLRARVADRRVIRLIGQFLKAGVLSEEQFLRTETGTPQGGIISPLLANIVLSVIEAKYERWVDHRTKLQARRTCDGGAAARLARNRDRRAGRPVFVPIRYADDFIILVSGSRDTAIAEKAVLAEYLRQKTGLELSPEKTKITAMVDGFEFLGFYVNMRWDRRYGYCPRIEVPKAQAIDLRYRVKQLTVRNTTLCSLGRKLQELNPIFRGWANY
ncbi:MAG: reverse transcriptase domain-containing protein [Pseudorhodoplanes sp.]|uniref:IS66-like element accessory protein TnpA n=1 Tax=Pseudorhodoplanes sp. TaxID=1934341 RepID=UPI003D0CF1F4